jgi:hypothetical protein
MTAYLLSVVYGNEMHYSKRTIAMITSAPEHAKNTTIHKIVEVYE